MIWHSMQRGSRYLSSDFFSALYSSFPALSCTSPIFQSNNLLMKLLKLDQQRMESLQNGFELIKEKGNKHVIQILTKKLNSNSDNTNNHPNGIYEIFCSHDNSKILAIFESFKTMHENLIKCGIYESSQDERIQTFAFRQLKYSEDGMKNGAVSKNDNVVRIAIPVLKKRLDDSIMRIIKRVVDFCG